VRYTGKTNWLTVVFVMSVSLLPVAAPASRSATHRRLHLTSWCSFTDKIRYS